MRGVSRPGGGDLGGDGRGHLDRAGELAAQVDRDDLARSCPGSGAWIILPLAQVDGDVRDVAGRGRVGVVEEQVTRLRAGSPAPRARCGPGPRPPAA